MQDRKFELLPYSDEFRAQVLKVWEKSVLATHDFLKPADFLSIKDFVKKIDFHAFEVYCLVESKEVGGFLGVADQKIEMLFLSPNFIGKGFGKKLMEFAINHLKTNKVDVNEGNAKAVEFYKKFGFEVYERTEKDDQGGDYPLLRMKLGKL